jgi:4-amino-4-deoxy-L-arabinose transferase-like glycosyltransferase
VANREPGLHASASPVRDPASSRRTPIVFLCLFVPLVLFRATIISRPFVANSESLAAGWVLSSARNFVRHGPVASRFAGVINSGEVPKAEWVIYSHHPPLTPLLGMAAMCFGGFSEWTGRLVPAMFSIATTVLLFFIVRARAGLRPAAVTAIFYALCPMTLALGDMAEYFNAPLVFCGIAAIESYVRWTETGRPVWLTVFAIAFVAGVLSDWPIFYLAPILCGHALTTRRASLRAIVAAATCSAALFATVAWWVLWSGGDVSVFDQLATRTSVKGMTVRGWILQVIIHHQVMLHTWPMLMLSFVYVAYRVVRSRTGHAFDQGIATTAGLLLAWGVMNLVIGVDGNYRHAWWSMVLTPGLAVTAALGLELVIRSSPLLSTRSVGIPLGVAALLLFVGSSARTARAFTLDQWFEGDGYTLKSIGSVIHTVAASSEGVLTTVETDHPALWFYADRQLRPGITTGDALRQSLDAGPYVVFGYMQPRGPAPSWFVMPASDRERLPQLAAALDASYPRREVAGAVVYRLRP